MQVKLRNWAGTAKNLPQWFKDESVIDITLEQIKELFDTGNNLMLCHDINNDIIVFVDNRCFSHR